MNMAHNIEYLISLANSLIARDAERDEDFEHYEEYRNMSGDWFQGLKKFQWIRKIANPAFSAAVESGIKTLATLEPDISWQPLAPNMKTKKLANEREQVLKWELMNINKRRQTNLVRDLVKSAIMYECIAAQVIDLEYQIKSAKEYEIPTERLEFMSRLGRFVVNVFNPRDVHTLYSNIMIENWLLSQVRTARDIYAEYGDRAGAEIKEAAEYTDDIVKYAYYYMWSPVESAVWACRTDNTKVGEAEYSPQIIIQPSEHGMKFNPFVWRTGADTLEKEERYRYHPMGFALLHGDIYNTANIADSIITSKAILMATRPTRKETGPAFESTTDYDPNDPNDTALVTPGNELEDMLPPQIDPQFYNMYKDTLAKVSSVTLAKILSNPEVPPGTAYATVNVLIMSALGQLRPYQQLAEYSLEDILERMILFSHYTGKPMTGYGFNTRDKKNYGRSYTIEPATIKPDAIYLKVTLRADLPLDKMANVNTANQAVSGLGMSKEYALEQIGVSNAAQVMEDRQFEQLVETKFAKIQTIDMGEAQAEVQGIIAKQQLDLQMAAAANNPQGVPGAEGMNPAEGNPPPAMANPSATRESQTGQTATGEQVQAPGMV